MMTTEPKAYLVWPSHLGSVAVSGNDGLVGDVSLEVERDEDEEHETDDDGDDDGGDHRLEVVVRAVGVAAGQRLLVLVIVWKKKNYHHDYVIRDYKSLCQVNWLSRLVLSSNKTNESKE